MYISLFLSLYIYTGARVGCRYRRVEPARVVATLKR